MVRRGDGGRQHERFEEREDYRRAAETVRGQLLDRGIELRGDETGDRLIELLEAVQQFEREVAERGGDSMSNAPDSRDPENPELVLPTRRADESTARYIRRIEQAADRLRRGD